MAEDKKGLTDFIRYENRKFSELTDEKEKEAVLNIARKLAPLENEIISQQKGRIVIKRNESFIVDSFPGDLGQRITSIL